MCVGVYERECVPIRHVYLSHSVGSYCSHPQPTVKLPFVLDSNMGFHANLTCFFFSLPPPAPPLSAHSVFHLIFASLDALFLFFFSFVTIPPSSMLTYLGLLHFLTLSLFAGHQCPRWSCSVLTSLHPRPQVHFLLLLLLLCTSLPPLPFPPQPILHVLLYF